jgi:hypothetical protein
MRIQELRVFFQEWMCGCGSPPAAARLVYDVLRVIETRWRECKALDLFKPSDRPALDAIWREEDRAMKALLPSDGVYYFVLYLLDRWDLLEHGGSVGGSWLTDRGRAVLEALEREAPDDFQRATEWSCVHGYAANEYPDEGTCPNCSAWNVSPQEPPT